MSTTAEPETRGSVATPAKVKNPLRRATLWVWQRWNSTRPFDPPRRSEWPTALRRARIVGFILLALQLVALAWWSTVMVSHYSMTIDFSLFEQAVTLISHRLYFLAVSAF
jgi:hypothetical protein